MKFIENLSWVTILISVIVAVVVILAIILIIALHKRKNKKGPHLLIDEEYMKKLIELYGNYSNINEIAVDGNKLKVNVKDLKIVNLDGIKELSSSGVFVTANNIKSLFKYDAKELKVELDKYKEGMR